MSDDRSTFVPVGETGERMFGPTGILMCGFSASEQRVVAEAWALEGLGEILVKVATEADLLRPCLELVTSAAPIGLASLMPRAILVSGLLENELHRVMRTYRQTGLPKPLWAALTEHSQAWALGALLGELEEERLAMEKASSGKGGTR